MVRKGKFTIDTIAKTIKFNYNSTFHIQDNQISNSNDFQKWKVLSINEKEIVISRPPIWKDEYPTKNGDGKSIHIILARVAKPIVQSVTLK